MPSPLWDDTQHSTHRRGRRTWRAGLVLAFVAAAVPLVASRAQAAGGGAGLDVLCSRADYGCVAGTGYHGQGVWGANHGRTGHNCTSYVSYRLAQEGVAEPWHVMGNAGEWDNRGAGKVPIDGTPAVGAVAEWEGHTRYDRGSAGHVAFVEAVTPTTIELTEDNSGGGTRRIVIHQGSAYWPSHFLHIHDLPQATAMVDGRIGYSNALHNPALSADEVVFGFAGDTAVAGDWNGHGKDTLGLFRDGTWTLWNGKDGKALRTTRIQFGQPGDVPVVGDWDGNGRDDLGVYRAGEWLLRTPTRKDPQHLTVVHLGAPGDLPVVGDWDGVDGDGIGVFHAGTWTLQDGLYDGAPTRQLTFGLPGDLPVAGHWSGHGGDGIGVYRQGLWLVSSALDPAHVAGHVTTFVFGDAWGRPLVGNWDAKGADGIAVAH